MSKLVICAIGAKGAIGTTLAAGILKNMLENSMSKYLMTNELNYPLFYEIEKMDFTGWDLEKESFESSFKKNKPFDYILFDELRNSFDEIKVFGAPNICDKVSIQKQQIVDNIKTIKNNHDETYLVMVNLLPASNIDYEKCKKLSISEIEGLSGDSYKDLPYLLSALEEEIPFVNFTPNPIELPIIEKKFKERKIPLCGKDGKTGQTFFKIVMASALKSRELIINGWYSTNILGNGDGNTLSDSKNSRNKIENKLKVLNDVLGYNVDNHIVRIDYYKPRKDAKEAWDVIDFSGFLNEHMSIRINLQGKDSILAAPIIIDLARWACLLKKNGIGGPIKELAFYFKAPIGDNRSYNFQDQWEQLNSLYSRLEK